MTNLIQGSFMAVVDVIRHFESRNIPFDHFVEQIVVIEGIAYLPTNFVKQNLSETQWRTMQHCVSTLIIGSVEIV